jgi:hypothetical protein
VAVAAAYHPGAVSTHPEEERTRREEGHRAEGFHLEAVFLCHQCLDGRLHPEVECRRKDETRRGESRESRESRLDEHHPDGVR